MAVITRNIINPDSAPKMIFDAGSIFLKSKPKDVWRRGSSTDEFTPPSDVPISGICISRIMTSPIAMVATMMMINAAVAIESVISLGLYIYTGYSGMIK